MLMRVPWKYLAGARGNRTALGIGSKMGARPIFCCMNRWWT